MAIEAPVYHISTFNIPFFESIPSLRKDPGADHQFSIPFQPEKQQQDQKIWPPSPKTPIQ
ncbi:hypothetical protein PROFUN_08922 [Planoprotostelium fungivorum]|uniref:Uncharacterized protein n=1 Tax=Planoprotostelium fungivorum TaxID=1890364 RepID=A0A2P6NIN9_9EUKA|nr:hypothetical protein PROFUN_08922 [Planoprotostelium fungivorum]